MATPKKTKVKVPQMQWSTAFDCPVEVLKRGHFPDTVMVKLPDGTECEADLAYLTNLKAA